jgi:hypothetical protein
MEKAICRDGIFHDVEIGRAFEEMLALSTRILCPDLLTIDTLNRETLQPR